MRTEQFQRGEKFMRTTRHTLRRLGRTTALVLVVGAFAVPAAQARLYADDGAGSASANAAATVVTDGLGREITPVASSQTATVTDGLGREITPVTVTDGLGREVTPVSATVSDDGEGFAWSNLAIGLGLGLGLLLVAALGVASSRRRVRPQPVA
jgi:hypothetical protein